MSLAVYYVHTQLHSIHRTITKLGDVTTLRSLTPGLQSDSHTEPLTEVNNDLDLVNQYRLRPCQLLVGST